MVGCSTCARVPKEGGSYRNPGRPPILETQGNIRNVCTDIFDVENYNNITRFQALWMPCRSHHPGTGWGVPHTRDKLDASMGQKSTGWEDEGGYAGC